MGGEVASDFGVLSSEVQSYRAQLEVMTRTQALQAEELVCGVKGKVASLVSLEAELEMLRSQQQDIQTRLGRNKEQMKEEMSRSLMHELQRQDDSIKSDLNRLSLEVELCKAKVECGPARAQLHVSVEELNGQVADLTSAQALQAKELQKLRTGFVQEQIRRLSKVSNKGFYDRLANDKIPELLQSYLTTIGFCSNTLYSEKGLDEFKRQCSRIEGRAARREWIGDEFSVVILGVMYDKKRMKALDDLSHIFGWTPSNSSRTPFSMQDLSGLPLWDHTLWVSQSLTMDEVTVAKNLIRVSDGDHVVQAGMMDTRLRHYIILRNRREAAVCSFMLDKLENQEDAVSCKKGYQPLHGWCHSERDHSVHSVSTTATGSSSPSSHPRSPSPPSLRSNPPSARVSSIMNGAARRQFSRRTCVSLPGSQKQSWADASESPR